MCSSDLMCGCVYVCTPQTLQADIQRLKDQVQEQHRDLTKHHSVISTDTMGAILERSLDIDSHISSQVSTVENTRATFLQAGPQAISTAWDLDHRLVPHSIFHMGQGFSPATPVVICPRYHSTVQKSQMIIIK